MRTPTAASLALGAALVASSCAARVQVPFTAGHGGHSYTDTDVLSGHFTPESNNDDGFTLFTHDNYPDRQIRYKRNDGWCDGSSTASWSGYLDYEDSHLFFYYFHSRNKPEQDPVVLWINGGPGCSSSMGMLMELGPCQIVEEGDAKNTTATTKHNPHSWNSNANLLFLDQPVGVGFSYSDNHKHVGTTEKAAKDVQAFVTMFFETFADLKGRPFHFAGESYGGRYIPLFAAAILDHNSKAVAGGMTPINLQSVMIGNGLTDVITAIPTYYDQACTNISGAPTGPVLDIHTCAELHSWVPTCEKWLKRACVDKYDVRDCESAHEKCTEVFMGPYMQALWNPYDVTKPCPTLHEDLCYDTTARIANYLDNEKNRKKLGVPLDRPNFEGCSNAVGSRFNRHNDETPILATYYYVTAMVERGVNVLIYNGKYDWICNTLSNKRWLDKLDWSGAQDYLAAPMKPWKAKKDGVEVQAGETKTAYSLGGGRLTFVSINSAGHMVPYDQPEVSNQMVRRWLAGDDL